MTDLNDSGGRAPIAENPDSFPIFIARQPVFDADKNVFAYELLYRSDIFNRAVVSDDRIATIRVLANTLSMGLQSLTGAKRAFIHFDPELILAGLPQVLPKELLGVEILNLRACDSRLIRMCRQLKNQGYPLLIDQVVYARRETNAALIELADIVRIDFSRKFAGDPARFIKGDTSGRVFLAEKIETHEQWRAAVDAGCSYFQGFFFQKPDIVSRTEMAGYKYNYLQILKKIQEPDPDIRGIEEIMRRDVSLIYKLLKFINSAAYGFRVTVRSIAHALVLLGPRELKKWLTIIVMSGAGRDKPAELMGAAAIRGRWCEMMALEFKWPYPSCDYFMLGLFSLVEAFLDRPMKEILGDLPLEEHVVRGLLGEDMRALAILEMVREYERANWEGFTMAAGRLDAAPEDAAKLYREAVEWAKFLSP